MRVVNDTEAGVTEVRTQRGQNDVVLTLNKRWKLPLDVEPTLKKG